jgi:hypothetical protein
MATLEYLCQMAGVNPDRLSKEENFLLEATLLCSVCDELTAFYKSSKIPRKIQYYQERDNMISHRNIINLILQDLIRSNDYTISGVATYSNVPEEVIYDIATGCNCNPTLEVSRKIIELHRNARTDLYQRVMQKITTSYSSEGGQDG